MKTELIFKDESYKIIGACFEVYREKGCGFLEAVYQECLEIELRLQGVPFVPSVRFRVFGVFRGLIPVTAVVPALCSLRLQLLAAGNLLWLLSCRFRV